jgi:inner membrane protease subunit 1
MTVYQRLFSGASSLRSLPYAKQVLTGVKAGVVVHLFLEYFYSVNLTYGPSMLPTLNFAGDWVLVDKSFRWGNNVAVGDLVSFKTPIEPGKGAIKRVVGMPGDFVERDSPGKGRGMTLQVGRAVFLFLGNVLSRSIDRFLPVTAFWSVTT